MSATESEKRSQMFRATVVLPEPLPLAHSDDDWLLHIQFPSVSSSRSWAILSLLNSKPNGYFQDEEKERMKLLLSGKRVYFSGLNMTGKGKQYGLDQCYITPVANVSKNSFYHQLSGDLLKKKISFW